MKFRSDDGITNGVDINVFLGDIRVTDEKERVYYLEYSKARFCPYLKRVFSGSFPYSLVTRTYILFPTFTNNNRRKHSSALRLDLSPSLIYQPTALPTLSR